MSVFFINMCVCLNRFFLYFCSVQTFLSSLLQGELVLVIASTYVEKLYGVF